MKPEQNYFLLGSEDPIRVRLTGVRKPPVIRRTSGNRSAEVDYYTTLLIEHLQEYFPGEMLLLKDLRARARIAYKESVRTNVPIADALANALRYLFFGFETSGFERLKSEIWMQGYYSQAKADISSCRKSPCKSLRANCRCNAANFWRSTRPQRTGKP